MDFFWYLLEIGFRVSKSKLARRPFETSKSNHTASLVVSDSHLQINLPFRRILECRDKKRRGWVLSNLFVASKYDFIRCLRDDKNAAFI